MKPSKLSFDQTYVCNKSFRLDFGLSSNPLGPSPTVLQGALLDGKLASFYPEVGYPDLVERIALFHGVPKDCIILGTGLDGLIYDIMHFVIQPGDELVLPQVTFPNAIYAAGGRGAMISQVPMKATQAVDFDQLRSSLSPKTKAIFLCNPNNPTGIYESLHAIENLLSATNALVIVDEANIEYAGASCLPLIKKYPHLMILRTFSKAYGMAGMRVGYGISTSSLLKEVAASRPPFFLASISARAACFALEDQNHIRHSVSYTAREREFLTTALHTLGFAVTPSQSNTLLCRVPHAVSGAAALLEELHQHDCHAVLGSYFNLPDHYLRIAPRLHDANEELVVILQSILKNSSSNFDRAETRPFKAGRKLCPPKSV